MKKMYSKIYQILILFVCVICIYFTDDIIKNIFSQSVKLSAQQSKKETASEPIKLEKIRTFRPDYRDKDIKDFLKLMSGLIGKNIITDDKVRGKITVVSPKKIPVSEALKYLSTVLSIKGLGIVEEGSILKVVPIKDAIASSQIIIYSNVPWMDMTDKEIESYSPSNISKKVIKKEKIITQIIEIQNSNPNVISSTLKQLTNKKTEIVTFKAGNLILITGGPLEVNRLVKLVRYIDFDDSEPEEEEENISEELSFGRFHVYRLENMESNDVVRSLNRLSVPEDFGELYNLQSDKIIIQRKESKSKKDKKKKAKKEENIKYKNLKLIAHKESNSILYVGTKKEFEQIKKLIKRIDLKREQVFFEVLIVEISSQTGNSVGVDPVSVLSELGGLNNDLNQIVSTTSTIPSSTGGDDIVSTQTTQLNLLSTEPTAAILFSVSKFGSLFRFLKTKENVNILSAPQVLAIDNEEATISSTESVPIVTVTSTQQSTQSGVQYRDVGIKLKVKPRITRDKNIQIDLNQEISNIISSSRISTAGVIAPSFRKREIKTTLRIKDNQTIAIGGLLIDEEIHTVSKIPFLGDIPLIGLLFKRKQKEFRKRSLFMFITPHIISNRKKADMLTNDVLKIYKQKLKEFKNKGQ